MSITARLSQHARAAPDRLALTFEGDRITWRDLDAAVHRLAAHIAAKVPERGGVALHLPNGPALAMLFLAAARAGREAQIVDPEWPAETTRNVLAELSPAMLVSSDQNFSSTEAVLLESAALPFGAVADALYAPSQPEPVQEPDLSLPFYVGFTSGSTGMPKGFRRSHRSWTESFRADALEFGIGATDVVLASGTLTHSLFLYALANGLHAGAGVVFCRRFHPNAVNRLVRQHEITVLYGVPTQLRLLVEAAEHEDGSSYPSVRWILSSGAKWFSGERPRLARAFPSARFAEFYGSSELSFVTVAKEGEPVPEDSVGRPFHGATVTIRDGHGRRLPSNRSGSVFVESPYLFMGYACGEAGALQRTGEAISVGDLGHVDENGFLYLVGRSNRMIVTSGKNVYPEEIERVLELHPAVRAAAVLAQSDCKRGERLVGLLQLRDRSPVTRACLVRHARRRLPLYKVPRIYAFVPDWPLVRSGKVDLEALERLWEAGACETLA